MSPHAHSRFLIASALLCATLLLIGYLVKIDLQPVALKAGAENHFTKVVGDNLTSQHRATDAFFIPTKYGAKHHFPKPNFDEMDRYRSKPIFSELDKIKIFNVFLKNFSESEYWVVSSLNLRPKSNGKAEKQFFTADVERGAETDYLGQKFYGGETQIPFKNESDEH
ncbi:MAG: hypothetical protein LBJ94_01445 [Puniceicoccales bacterium]|jgi:hypothetical protein|nr:hypothetical protein [Puniceicoccales bacterium]